MGRPRKNPEPASDPDVKDIFTSVGETGEGDNTLTIRAPFQVWFNEKTARTVVVTVDRNGEVNLNSDAFGMIMTSAGWERMYTPEDHE